jgi:cardiolipin synthase
MSRLVRRNSHSALTANNAVAIQQDAAVHYSSLIADLQSARYSFSINCEINAVIYDAALARELEAAFERYLECTRFDAAEFEERPVLSRLKDSAARLLSPLL